MRRRGREQDEPAAGDVTPKMQQRSRASACGSCCFQSLVVVIVLVALAHISAVVFRDTRNIVDLDVSTLEKLAKADPGKEQLDALFVSLPPATNEMPMGFNAGSWLAHRTVVFRYINDYVIELLFKAIVVRPAAMPVCSTTASAPRALFPSRALHRLPLLTCPHRLRLSFVRWALHGLNGSARLPAQMAQSRTNSICHLVRMC